MRDQGLGGWIDTRRAVSPERIAVIPGDGEPVSYGALADRIDGLAEGLRREGVVRGGRVAFCGENSAEFLETFFAVASLGAVFVPVNTRLAPPEVAHILRGTRPELVIHDAASATGIAAAIEDVREIPRFEIGREAADGGYEQLVVAGAHRVETDVTLDDPAIVLYTSGTTGAAKGAVLTHGNLTWNALNVIVDLDLASTDVALIISPMFHAASLGMGVLPTLLKGGAVVLERRFLADRALRLIEKHGVTMLSGVPTTFQFLAEHPDWEQTDLTSLRHLTCGGSPVPIRVIDAFEARGLGFSQGYGMTEASPGVTILQPSMSRLKVGSVGRPHFFCDVRVVDEFGEPLAAGEVGEIQVAGPNVMLGYLDDPAATDAAFTADGWLRTGDLGYFDDEGYLYVADRIKDLIISGAENIHPAEVEEHIMRLGAVSGVAVIGVPDERWGEVPWAIVTLADGATFDAAEVGDELDGKLARYKIPKNVVVVDDLPRTASGKVKRNALRERFGSDRVERQPGQ